MKFRSKKKSRAKKSAQRRQRLHQLERLEDRRLLVGDLLSPDGSFIEGDLMVQFAPNATLAEKQAAVQQIGGTVERNFDFINGALLKVPTSSDENELASVLEGLPQVVYAGHNRIFQPTLTPNDPLYDLQWALNNTGQDPTGGTPDADIDAPEAWDIFQGSTETVVAVLDSGIDWTHPDIQANLWNNPFETPGNGIDDDGNGFVDDYFGVDTADLDGDPMDQDGHGTGVAGIIAATGDNGIGITGANWNTKILSVRMGDAGFSTAAIIDGLDYITDMKLRGVNIVASNNSYGGPAAMVDPMLFAAVSESINNGIVFVAAAGNTSDDNDIIFDEPSGYDLDGLISVAATDRDDNLASFSNFGQTTVDLGAPGEQVLTLALNGTVGVGVPDNYVVIDGTSFSSPYVAAAVSLAAGLNPSLSVLELKDAVLNSVDVIDSLTDITVTGGRLNIGRLLDDLPSGGIEGRVIGDANGNGVLDGNETGLGGFTVFSDLNGSGIREANEPFAISQFDGRYVLPHFSGPGTFNVIVELQPGTEYTQPSNGERTVTVGSFVDVVTGVDFGVRTQATGVGGRVVQENNDPLVVNPGVPGVYVFADLDNDGRADINEPFSITDGNGDYTIDLPTTGQFTIMPQLPPGWTILDPVTGSYIADVVAGVATVGLNFTLEGQMLSLPAAPPTYGSPSHGILPGFQIGDELIGVPSTGAATPSEDGITFSVPLTEGASVVPMVDIHTSGQPRGYFNLWVDLDGSGTFDAGEQMVANERLGEDIHTLPAFTVPTGVVTGDTWARARFGWEYGMTATAEAFAGELQDFVVTVFGNEPVAREDAFTVLQNSVFGDAENTFDVLDNDIVSASGGVLTITDFDTTTAENGTVQRSGTNLQYQPRLGFFGTDSFSYTVTDGLGAMSTTVVSVTVTPNFSGPFAIDDMFAVNPNFVGGTQVSTPLLVTDNDLLTPELGVNTFLNTVIAPASNGLATVFDNETPTRADDVISYTPNAGFQGTDQFTYQLIDSNGAVSEATVTVQVGDVTGDDILEYTIGFSDADGNPIMTIGEETTFYADVYVRDIRPNPVFPPLPATQVDRRGVFAAYVDVQFDRNQLVVVGEPSRTGAGAVPDSPFVTRQDGSIFVPGLVDELGGITPTNTNETPPPTGTDPLLVARIPVRAQAGTAGSTITVATDPANLLGVDVTDDVNEISGIHDTLIFEPSTDADVNEIRFQTGSITVTGVSGEGEGHNRFTPTDVNNDRRRDLFDLRDMFASLLVSGAVTTGPEGESGSRQLMLDVNNDGYASVGDLRLVYNDIMSILLGAAPPTGGEGEAEGEAALSTAQFADAPTVVSGSSTSELVDLALASSADKSSSDRSGVAQQQTDDLFADLEDDFFQDINDIWN